MSPCAWAFVDGYWCEVVARSTDLSREWYLGGYRASSPRLAVRWLRGQAERIVRALDPRPGGTPFPPECLRPLRAAAPHPGLVLGRWAHDLRAQDIQLDALRAGRLVSVTARDADAFYALSARPIAVGFGVAGAMEKTAPGAA